MWKALIPNAGNTHLVSTFLCGLSNDGVQIFCSSFGSIKFCFTMIFFRIYEAFYPNLANLFILPVGKQTNTITCRHDLFKVLLYLRKWHIGKDPLSYHKGWNNIKCNFSNNTYSTKTNY